VFKLSPQAQTAPISHLAPVTKKGRGWQAEQRRAQENGFGRAALPSRCLPGELGPLGSDGR
jgi:hypothetical protein